MIIKSFIAVKVSEYQDVKKKSSVSGVQSSSSTVPKLGGTKGGLGEINFMLLGTIWMPTYKIKKWNKDKNEKKDKIKIAQ